MKHLFATKNKIPHRGDVYWIDQNPIAGREMKDRHRFIVITPREINVLGIVMTVPITSGGAQYRKNGLTVPITGHDTTDVAVCNRVRSFDIEARTRAGSAKYIETIDKPTMTEKIHRVISLIEPTDYINPGN